MIRLVIFLFLLTGFSAVAFAQESESRSSNIYIGIQANQLVRQIFNFSNTSTSINNPYLLSFSVNSTKNGAGFSLGLGYTFNEISEGDAILKQESRINDFFLRAGFDRKSKLSSKWNVNWGIDIVLDRQNNKTKTTQTFQVETTTETKTKIKATGLGPRLALNYQISDKVLLGTECNYYFKSGKNETSVRTRTAGQTTLDDDSEKFKRFQFNVPMALFLILKL